MSRLFLLGGRLDEALVEARRSVALDPRFAYGHQAMGEAYRAKGMLTEALAEYGRAEDLGWHGARPGRALTLAQMGRSAEARRLVRELEEESTRQYVAPDWIAAIYGRLGDKDTAFSWLERTLETRSMWMASKDLPDWDPIRRDPRFAAIVRRMGLAP
jgi:tetratricopeptide (TPR) repeat protein